MLEYTAAAAGRLRLLIHFDLSTAGLLLFLDSSGRLGDVALLARPTSLLARASRLRPLLLTGLDDRGNGAASLPVGNSGVGRKDWCRLHSRLLKVVPRDRRHLRRLPCLHYLEIRSRALDQLVVFANRKVEVGVILLKWLVYSRYKLNYALWCKPLGEFSS